MRVQLTADVTATIYNRPGEWMSDVDLARLREEVRGVAQAAIPGDLTYGVFRPERRPYETRLIVIGRHETTGDVVGFNAMPRLDVEVRGKRVQVMHLGLLVIHPQYQRRGFQGLLYGLGAFSLYHRLRERPVWISNVTEVPAVFGAVADRFLDVYPHYAQPRPPPPVHLEIARQIMAHHRHEFGVGQEAGFDEQRFVIQGSYTGGSDALKKSFDSAPRHRKEAVNRFCQEQLDYSRGDDFLQLGQFDTTVMTNWIQSRLPAPLRPHAARTMKLWTYPKAG
ncbi:MAG TPA: hypothetical protein VND93_24355 [Myxococcales bacterium]|nr:hypothetical protein [Myxococcales bacterium]